MQPGSVSAGRTSKASTSAAGPGVEGLLMRLGSGLHAAGAPAYRIEDALGAVAERLGLVAQFFSTPTSLFAAFGQGDRQRTFLERVQPGGIDLGRMSDLDELLELAADPRSSIQLVRDRLGRVEAAPPRFGPVLELVAFGLASSAAAVFFNGSTTDVVVSGLLGLMVGTLPRLLSRSESRRLFEPLAAFLAMFFAVLVAGFQPQASDWVMTLAAVIVLVPGLTLTVGLSELAASHLMSGTARLAGAATTFLSLALGVGLGRQLGLAAVEALAGAERVAPSVAALPASVTLGPWIEVAAMLVAPVTFAVLFRARRRDIPWILGTGVLAFRATRAASEALGSELGAFTGALLVGLAGNLFARSLHRPAQVIHVPGLILLVPGSLGFHSVAAFLAQDALGGVQEAFAMLLVGGGLVGGLFVAGVLVSPIRSL